MGRPFRKGGTIFTFLVLLFACTEPTTPTPECAGDGWIGLSHSGARWITEVRDEDLNVVSVQEWEDEDRSRLREAESSSWEDGSRVERRQDFDGDGEDDVVTTWTWEGEYLVSAEQTSTTEWDNCGTGVLWREEYQYRDGLLERIEQDVCGDGVVDFESELTWESGRQATQVDTWLEDGSPTLTTWDWVCQVPGECGSVSALDHVETVDWLGDGEPERVVYREHDLDDQLLLEEGEQWIVNHWEPWTTEQTWDSEGRLSTHISRYAEVSRYGQYSWTEEGLPAAEVFHTDMEDDGQVESRRSQEWKWTCR